MAFSLRTHALGAMYYRLMGRKILPSLQKAGLTANQMTLIGVILALLVPVGFYIHPLAGLLLMLASGVADTLDGSLARRHNQTSPFGAFLDSSLDRLSDFLYLSGFWVLFWDSPKLIAATALMFSALLFTVLISYVKARAESLGVPCGAGFLERALRVIYLIFWALLILLMPSHRNALLWLGLILYNLLTFSTVLQRIVHIRREFIQQDD